MSNFSLKSNLNAILGKTNGAIAETLELLGQVAEGNAVVNAPKDTGELRGSITHKVNAGEQSVYIGTNKEYAPYVEYGTGIYASEGGGRQTPWFYKDRNGVGHFTRGQKPTHFLRNAINDHIDEYERIASQCLKDNMQ